MSYTKPYTIDASPGADTVKEAVATKTEGNVDYLITSLNAHEALTTGAHGVGAGTIVGTALEQTLTNKTLTTPIIASIYQDAGKTKLMTLPNTASDTLCAIAATQTLTNKTLTTPIIASVYIDAGKTKLMSFPNVASDTIVLANAEQTLAAKTLTTPTIASFANAGHTHADAAGGGQLDWDTCFSDAVHAHSSNAEGGTLTATAALLFAATDKVLGRATAGAGAAEEIACTSAGRALLDDADAAAQRTTLGLGTIATQAANNVAITGGSITGITDLAVADGGTGVSESKPVIQQVRYSTGAVNTGTTLIPFDDTIPQQSTEGTLFMSLAITPKSASNILKIDVTIVLSDAAADVLIAALFQDTTENALASVTQNTVVGGIEILNFTHYMVAGTTNATTFKVHGGHANASTITFNGIGGGRIFGGTMSSSIIITEIAP